MPCYTVAFSPDGKTLSSGQDLSEVPSGKAVAIFGSGLDFSIKCVAFRPDGKMLATGSDEKTIKLWDLPLEKIKTK